jgi:hypothetical protein
MCAQQQGGDQEPNRQLSSDSGGAFDEYPLKEGGLFGAGAFVVGYLVTYVLVVVDTQVLSKGFDDVSFEGVGMLFYNAQFVRLDVGGDATYDLLTQMARLSDSQPTLDNPLVVDTGLLNFPMLTYTLLVSVVLIGAGYLLTSRVSTPGSSVADRMEAGMTLAVGYLPLAFFGGFLFEDETILGTNNSVSPDIFAGVLVAGLVFPLVFGAIGGYLSQRQ